MKGGRRHVLELTVNGMEEGDSWRINGIIKGDKKNKIKYKSIFI